MENNLLIGGLKETADEDCHHIVQKFLYDTLGIIKLDDGIYEAHRMGAVRKSGPPRLMQIKCSTPQRMMIMDNVKSLKGKKNEDGFSIYVTKQQPEAIREKQKHNQELIQEIRENNRKAPKDKQTKFKIIRNQIYIDGEKLTDPIIPPEPEDLFFKSPEEQEKLDDIKFIPSAPTVSQGSYFCGYITTASSLTQVKQAYTCLYQTIPKSDHVMTAYKITLSDGKELTGASSDREYGAGKVVREVLESKGLNNVVVFVRRRYGGSHLGPKRFQIIKQCATEAINKYIKKVLCDPNDHQDADNDGYSTPSTP